MMEISSVLNVNFIFKEPDECFFLIVLIIKADEKSTHQSFPKKVPSDQFSDPQVSLMIGETFQERKRVVVDVLLLTEDEGTFSFYYKLPL